MVRSLRSVAVSVHLLCEIPVSDSVGSWISGLDRKQGVRTLFVFGSAFEVSGELLGFVIQSAWPS